jgi:hypothetical protein
MSYIQYADKYLPGRFNRFTPKPRRQDSMSSKHFQRFLSLQRDPTSLYRQAVRLPEGFTNYMNMVQEFGLDPSSF